LRKEKRQNKLNNVMKKIIFIFIWFGINAVYAQENSTCYCYYFDTTCISHIQIDTNSTNIWQIGLPQKNSFTTLWGDTMSKAIITDTLNPYPVNNHSSFTIWNVVGMGDYYGLKILSGLYMVETDSLNDFGSIEFSPDMGNTWVDIVNDTTYCANLTWYSNKPILTGNSNEWKCLDVLLADLGSLFNIQMGDTLLYRFSFTSDSIYDNLGGLMFDNICFFDFVEGVTEVRFDNIKSKIYPNPSNNLFTIDFENPYFEEFNLSIYDRNSKLVHSESNISGNTITINAQSFVKGEYFYKLTSQINNKRTWGKFITL